MYFSIVVLFCYMYNQYIFNVFYFFLFLNGIFIEINLKTCLKEMGKCADLIPKKKAYISTTLEHYKYTQVSKSRVTETFSSVFVILKKCTLTTKQGESNGMMWQKEGHYILKTAGNLCINLENR